MSRDEAFAFGITLAAFSVVMLWLATNALAAGILAFTIFFYVVIYTIGLKRWTPQNIVIGGAAGAFPPMIGWAAATGTVSIESVLMFALIFMWTPPHFWALALFMRGDYDQAGVPMLTVTHGRPATRAHILVYTVLLAVLAIGAAATQIGGPVYLAVALVFNALFPARRGRDLAPRRGWPRPTITGWKSARFACRCGIFSRISPRSSPRRGCAGSDWVAGHELSRGA